MTEENNSTSTSKKRTWLKWLWLIPLLVALIYFGKYLLPKEISLAPSFTEYGELDDDTIAVYLPDDFDTIPEIMPIVLDSIPMEDSAALSLNFKQLGQDSTEKIIDSTDILSILPLTNTSEITPAHSKTPESAQLNQNEDKSKESSIAPRVNISVPKTTFFDHFFFTNSVGDSLQQQFFERNILTSKTVLTILAITGKEMLLHGNTTDNKEILESLVSEAAITGILLCDQNGSIKYASNNKFLNDDIRNVFPNFDLNYTSIGWGKNEQQTVTTMPIFHTFGRIGTVVLMTKG